MNKEQMLFMLTECFEDWYDKPSKGQMLTVRKDLSYAHTAVKSIKQYILDSPLEPESLAECVAILNGFYNQMVDGVYESTTESSKRMFEVGKDVASDMMDVLMAADDGKEH